jgi:protein-tyrosine phosphatase
MNPPLRLQGVSNIRELGGIRTADGRRVRTGRVYRSASLHEMTPADRAALRELGISVVADLRSSWERDQQPYEIGFARVVHAPMASGEQARSITERFIAGQMTSDELENWWELTGIFDAPEKHVFLEALGVPRETVADDFTRSDMMADEHVHTSDNERMRRAVAAMHLTPTALKAITSVDRAWLDRLMEGIEARHGSVHDYLAHFVGIGADGIDRLRASYLEPAR